MEYMSRRLCVHVYICVCSYTYPYVNVYVVHFYTPCKLGGVTFRSQENNLRCNFRSSD